MDSHSDAVAAGKSAGSLCFRYYLCCPPPSASR